VKKHIYLIIIAILIFSLSSCSSGFGSGGSKYILLDNGNIVAPDGTEYIFLTIEGNIAVFGASTFIAKIKDEKPSLDQGGGIAKTGMYSIEGDPELNILQRVEPDNQWTMYYRKATLPDIDLSAENCVRFELIGYKEVNNSGTHSPEFKHMSCNEGINDMETIKEFLSDMKNQKTRDEAGLYDLVKKPDGSFDNCYLYGTVYGFFINEANLAIPFDVTSYNDEAFSIFFAYNKFSDSKEYFDNNEIVLPDKWLDALQSK
jgi:hypothetical protein